MNDETAMTKRRTLCAAGLLTRRVRAFPRRDGSEERSSVAAPFVIGACRFIRHSDFVIRHSPGSKRVCARRVRSKTRRGERPAAASGAEARYSHPVIFARRRLYSTKLGHEMSPGTLWSQLGMYPPSRTTGSTCFSSARSVFPPRAIARLSMPPR